MIKCPLGDFLVIYVSWFPAHRCPTAYSWCPFSSTLPLKHSEYATGSLSAFLSPKNEKVYFSGNRTTISQPTHLSSMTLSKKWRSHLLDYMSIMLYLWGSMSAHQTYQSGCGDFFRTVTKPYSSLSLVNYSSHLINGVMTQIRSKRHLSLSGTRE